MSKLTDLLVEFNNFQTEYKRKAKEAFNEAVQTFFVENTDVAMIHWVQYSPFFNDGDECVFRVHSVECSNTDDTEDFDYMGGELELSEEATEAGKWVHPEYRASREVPGFEELSTFINSNEDLMEELFGNHAQITITRAGISVDEYEHD